jgi:hypothetical protein
MTTLCTPTNLPYRIRKLVADKSQAEDSKKLREENAVLHLELGTLISENQAARKQGEEALAAAERIRAFAHQAGEVVAMAELFDEKVGVGSKPSGTRIAMILTDYAEKLERILVDMREVVNNVTYLRSHPERPDLAASSSKSFPTLSKLSLPDSFSGLPNVKELTRVEVTPESKGVKGLMDAIRSKSKSKSPVKKSRDVLMTSVTEEGETGSGKERFPVPDLNVRKGLTTPWSIPGSGDCGISHTQDNQVEFSFTVKIGFLLIGYLFVNRNRMQRQTGYQCIFRNG